MVLSHLDNNVGVSVPLTMFNEERTFKIAESYIVDLTSKIVTMRVNLVKRET